MEEILNITNYEQYKRSLDKEFQRTAEGFVRIGYLLRMARDTDILKDSQYENVNEFAKSEYNLERTQVSRFISINERFSNPENMEELRENYRGFGVAKLAIMLQLPDSLNEELSPAFTKAEVQNIREELAEEEKVSDIERMIEPVPGEIEQVNDILGQAIIALGKDDPELYKSIHEEARVRGRIDVEHLKDDMAPNEEAIFSIRVPGKGRLFLTMKTSGDNSVVNARTGEKQKYTWEDVARAWERVIDYEKDAIRNWEERYGEAWPVKEEVAPVQRENQEKKSKVTKAKPEKRKMERAEETKKEEDTSEPEEPICDGNGEYKEADDEGIDKDLEEAGEEQERTKNIDEAEQMQQSSTVEEKERQDIKDELQSGSQRESTEKGYAAAVTRNLDTLKKLWDGQNERKISLMLDVIRDLQWKLEKIQQIEEKGRK